MTRASADMKVETRHEMRGGSGATILSLSRVEAAFGGDAPGRLAGNLATGGPDMPRIAGRMERAGTGGMVFRLVMQPYTAGTSSLAIRWRHIAGVWNWRGRSGCARCVPWPTSL